ncbi:MAG: iron-containing alcohol dehydrogenase [Anaerolineales bacterium]|nr:iron-containing alcohol dehydrogenase [Anaerolineales bacterium]
MSNDIFIYIGPNAAEQLIEYSHKYSQDKFMIVADENTYAAAGQSLETQLKVAGFDVKTALLTGAEIIADEHYFIDVMLQAGQEARTYLAVGSGSITDITRFVSFHTRTDFIAFPTAASVDGYTSAGAPSVIAGFKKTVMCHSPQAVFGDLAVLSAAPQVMTASGFGDMLGKYIALADWQIGHLLWDEPFDAEICGRVQTALQNCVDHAAAIGQASTEGLQVLLDGLIESGFCMLDFNGSRPASGAEHQISHHLEMKLIEQHRPAVLHGAKVGASTIIMARLYDKLRQVSREKALERLEGAELTPADEHRQAIRAAYPAIADKVMAEQSKFLAMTEADFDRFKHKIADHWTEIQAIAATVPSPDQLAAWLTQVGGATTLQSLGFSDAEVAEAVKNAHYLRDRFNVDKLVHVIGLGVN